MRPHSLPNASDHLGKEQRAVPPTVRTAVCVRGHELGDEESVRCVDEHCVKAHLLGPAGRIHVHLDVPGHFGVGNRARLLCDPCGFLHGSDRGFPRYPGSRLPSAVLGLDGALPSRLVNGLHDSAQPKHALVVVDAQHPGEAPVIGRDVGGLDLDQPPTAPSLPRVVVDQSVCHVAVFVCAVDDHRRRDVSVRQLKRTDVDGIAYFGHG
ncbi:MAG: hypothetical protein OEW45_21525 [Deltaproteobacteria bacterium]|nr:hypothetical protein [Deltaproteobacteria bacterium]